MVGDTIERVEDKRKAYFRKVWAKSEREGETFSLSSQTFFQKPIDKSSKVWYNNTVIKERGWRFWQKLKSRRLKPCVV
jgi:hypothetical protein